jgi:hypothetical protein
LDLLHLLTSELGPERRFAAMQRYSRYRRKTGLITGDLDLTLLTRAHLANA